MNEPQEIAKALHELVQKRFKDNPFPVDQFLIHVNNNLDIKDKFKSTDELMKFKDACVNSVAFRGPIDGLARTIAFENLLYQYWKILRNKPSNPSELPYLLKYFDRKGLAVKTLSEEEIEKNEDIQWTFIRDNHLNKATEQIIFNYQPAEIGDDDNSRTRKLRRDLIVNLGLVTGLDYISIKDLQNNRDVDCNYVFVVPNKSKAEALWFGIMKELARAIHECSKSIEGITLNKYEIYNMALEKLLALCSDPYNNNAQTFFNKSAINLPELHPINVFSASNLYCWAPTVVLTTSDPNIPQRGFIIYQDKDVGVAEMTNQGLNIWQSTILKGLEDKSEAIPFSKEDMESKRADIYELIDKL